MMANSAPPALQQQGRSEVKRYAALRTSRPVEAPAAESAPPPRGAVRPLPELNEPASAESALRAAEMLLRHPPLQTDGESPVTPWIQDIAQMVGAARRQIRGPENLNGNSRRELPPVVENPADQPEEPSVATPAPRPPRHPTRGLRDAPPLRSPRDPCASAGRVAGPGADLRERLNDLHEGEDARTNIERQRGRRDQEQSCDSEDFLDFLANPPLPTRRAEEADSFTGGCKALSHHLRAVRWPTKFRPDLPEKYDGSTPPEEFLQIYSTAVQAAGGDEAVMANYFHVGLKGSVRTWFLNLTPGSIISWHNLCREFIANFKGSSKRPGTENDLRAVSQRPAETLRQFIQRFSQVRNNIPRISPVSVIRAFHDGVRDPKMLEKLATHELKTTAELFSLADKCARAEEGRLWHLKPQLPSGQGPKPPVSAPRPNQDRNKAPQRPALAPPAKRKADEVLAADAPKQRPEQEEQRRDDKPETSRERWCPYHNTDRHDISECHVVRNFIERRRNMRGPGGSGPPGNNERRPADQNLGFQDPSASLPTFSGGSTDLPSKCEFKAMERTVCAVSPAVDVQRRLKWSEVPIQFSSQDHPDTTAGLGLLPLIVSPTIHNVKIGRVLIDGGAGPCLIQLAAYEKLQLPTCRLMPTRPLLGLGNDPIWPQGQVILPVTFGTRDNYRTESITFDVAETELPYNAILGRAAIVKFMAIPHYAYRVLKMPGPKGVIIVPADKMAALACAEHMRDAVSSAVEEVAGKGRAVQKKEEFPSPAKKRPIPAEEEKPKVVPLAGDPSKTIRVGANLDPK